MKEIQKINDEDLNVSGGINKFGKNKGTLLPEGLLTKPYSEMNEEEKQMVYDYKVNLYCNPLRYDTCVMGQCPECGKKNTRGGNRLCDACKRNKFYEEIFGKSLTDTKDKNIK